MPMEMRPILSQRLEMKLRMTSQMIQSIEMLQLPLLALQERIEQELVENPVLEIEEETVERDPAQAEEEEREWGDGEKNEFEKLEQMAADEGFSDYLQGARRPRAAGEDIKTGAMQNLAARGKTLQKHLEDQLSFVEADGRTVSVAREIVYDLDDNGYLPFEIEEAVASLEIDPLPTEEEIRRALELVQSLEPAGVGARSVEECLLLQLNRGGGTDLERKLIAEHFDDVLNNRLPKVARELGVSLEELKDAIKAIGRFNPHPGLVFSPESPAYAVPDVVIEEMDGEYVVRTNDRFLRRVRISSYYRQLLARAKRGSATRDYVREKMQAGKWLIDSIEQRRHTLLRIADEIATAQKEFFDEGVSHLRPLMMQEVADRLGIHVSTVSRALAGKYVDTPQGVFPMKYFFSGGYSSSSSEEGGAFSNKAVMNRIRELIGAEDKRSPLSDSEIVRRIKEEGIPIARRTVAKYRVKLDIPSSRQRKAY